jgi:hypothetical protein|tara:strand:+ start:60 stop:254 length:195 start_codon:yes stop_codon:yes gene_type:complete
MKIKGKISKLHRVNPNAVQCEVAMLAKLKDGDTVDIPEKAAKELLNMGVVEKADNKKKKKKESK